MKPGRVLRFVAEDLNNLPPLTMDNFDMAGQRINEGPTDGWYENANENLARSPGSINDGTRGTLYQTGDNSFTTCCTTGGGTMRLISL